MDGPLANFAQVRMVRKRNLAESGQGMAVALFISDCGVAGNGLASVWQASNNTATTPGGAAKNLLSLF